MARNPSDRAKRRQAGCESAPVSVPGFARPKARPVPKCDPVVEPIPEEFFRPLEGPPAPAPNLVIPAALPIGNDQQTLTCADIAEAGPEGESVTIPAQTFIEQFFFASIVELSPAQLNYIASLSQEVLLTLVPKAVDADSIALILKLNDTQATAVRNAFDETIDVVNAQAITSATAALVCVWWNTEQTATCAEDALIEGPEGLETAVLNPSVVTAGVFSSTLSQDDADQQALNQAQAELRCLWGNDEVLLACDSLGFAEPVPNDAEEVFPGLGLRVGAVIIAPNTLFSPDSKLDANNLALSTAQQQLNCFYINTAILRTCEELGKYGVDDLGQGNAVTGVKGSSVLVPAGLVISTISSAVANADALTLAESLLICQWSNDAMSAVCPDVVIYADTPEEQTIYPSQTLSPTYSSEIAAGTYTSEISKEDANTTAALLLTAQLQCIYCNNKIAPLCIPSNIAVEPPVPESMVDETWSLDATLGLAAGTFCGPLAEEVAVIADTVATLPVRIRPDGDNCLYGNSEISVSCIESPGVLGLFDSSIGADLSENSRPNPFATDPEARKITIAANTVTVRAGDVPVDFQPGELDRNKNYANDIALQQGLSFLDCFFENNETTYTCEGDLGRIDVSANSVNNITIKAGTFSSKSSKLEAQLQADAIGLASLDCFYENAERTFTCAIDKEKLSVSANSTDNVVISAGAFTSYVSQSEADNQATALGLASLNCFYENAARIFTCSGDLNKHGVSTKSTDNISIGAGAFISYTSQLEADLEAEAIGLASLNCFYENMRLRILCDNGANNGTYDPPPNQQGSLMVYGDGSMARIGTYANLGGYPVHAASNGSTTNPIYIEKGSFTSTVSLEEANRIALESGKGQLNCFWKNTALQVRCGATAAMTITPGGGSAYGEGSIGGDPVHAASTGAANNPVQIAINTFISSESPEAAALMALLMGISQLDCFWRNVTTTAECVVAPITHVLHPSATGMVIVPGELIQSYVSQADAANTADQIIKGQLRCIYGNPFAITKDQCPDDQDLIKAGVVEEQSVTSFSSSLDAMLMADKLATGFMVCSDDGDGAPGNDGPQTGCTSNCFGFYS